MASQWPVIVDRLLVLLPSLPGWSGVEVFDGPPVTSDTPADFCTVGFVDSLDGVGDSNAGEYTKRDAVVDSMLDDLGSVRCQLTCVSGDVSQADVRARAFALADALEASLRADPRLGVLPITSTTELGVQVLSIQNSAGAAQSLILVLTYFSRS